MRIAPVLVLLACGSSSSPPPPVANAAVAPKPVVKSTHGLELKVVDSDAPYMQMLFLHVGMERDGAATDPAAISAGVTMELDAWRIDADPKRHSDFYLQGQDRATLERYVEQLVLKEPRFILPSDRELRFEQVEARRWRSYYLEKAVRLDGSMVKDATSEADPNTGIPTVWLDLDEEGTRRLADVTKQIVGRKLAIVVDGVVRSAPIINGEIAGGRVSIRMGGSDPAQQARDAAQLVDALKQ